MNPIVCLTALVLLSPPEMLPEPRPVEKPAATKPAEVTGYGLLVAHTLIGSPPETPEQCSKEEFPQLQAAIHAVAIEMEILDEREKRYVLTRHEDFQNDLDLIRRRNVELKDAPRVMDGQRFPDRPTANDLIRFNRSYRKHLETRAAFELDRAPLINRVIQETDKLYGIWDAVRDARCDFYYVTVRRGALLKLKKAIGEEAYLAAEMPDYVPTWRFVDR